MTDQATTHTYTITGHDAIRHAAALGLVLCKHSDPVEDAREGLTEDEAREVAREDPSLIYATVSDEAELIAHEGVHGWSVEDVAGGVWWPRPSAASDLEDAEDPAALALVICAYKGLMAGEWAS